MRNDNIICWYLKLTYLRFVNEEINQIKLKK